MSKIERLERIPSTAVKILNGATFSLSGNILLRNGQPFDTLITLDTAVGFQIARYDGKHYVVYRRQGFPDILRIVESESQIQLDNVLAMELLPDEAFWVIGEGSLKYTLHRGMPDQRLVGLNTVSIETRETLLDFSEALSNTMGIPFILLRSAGFLYIVSDSGNNKVVTTRNIDKGFRAKLSRERVYVEMGPDEINVPLRFTYMSCPGVMDFAEVNGEIYWVDNNNELFLIKDGENIPVVWEGTSIVKLESEKDHLKVIGKDSTTYYQTH